MMGIFEKVNLMDLEFLNGKPVKYMMDSGLMA